MTTVSDINAWFPNSGTATPANLRTALISGVGAATVIQNFHDAADGDAALTTLGVTTTGLAVAKAANQAAARAAIGVPGAPSAINVRTGSHSLAASGVPGHELFNIGAAATLTLPSLASCPAQAVLTVVNFYASSAPLTIARSGADVIDGRTSLTIYPGESIQLVVSGQWRPIDEPVGWRRIRRVVTSGLPATVDLALPSEFSMFDLRFSNLLASAAAAIQLRVSVDGGATYLSGAADYQRTVIQNNAGTPAAGEANQSFFDISIGTVEATAQSAAFGSMQIRPGGGGAGAGGICDVTNRVPATHLQRRMSSFIVLGSTTRASHIRIFPSTGTLADGCELVLLGLT